MAKQQLTILLLLLLACAWQAVAAPVEAASVAQRRPQGVVQVLYYNRGLMERTFRNHANPAFARTGDYVPGLYRRSDADGLTAVSYNSRWMVRANIVLIVDLWDARQHRWERHRLQAADWQMKRDSTGSRQRLEVDWQTARRVNMTPQNTVARIVGLSYP